MDGVEVFLAFPDGALTYDCAACDQRCCKTGHLAVFPAERERLLVRHPSLDLVSGGSPTELSMFVTPPGGCWFLEQARCRLAETPDLRPAACALFPFNVFGLIGETFVVAPNALCPLRPTTAGGVSHQAVVATLRSTGAAGLAPSRLRPRDPPADVLALERLLREAGRAALAEPTPWPLLAFCRMAERTVTQEGAAALARLDLGAMADELARLDAATAEAARALGITVPNDLGWQAVAPLLACFGTSLRLFAFEEVAFGRLTEALLVLGLLGAHWQSLAPRRPLTAHALMQLASSHAPAIVATVGVLDGVAP